MSELQTIIKEAFERRAEITPRNIETLCHDAILEAIECLKTALEKTRANTGINELLRDI